MSKKFDPESVENFSMTREMYDWVESAILAVVCMLLIFTFIGRMIGVEGGSMENTLFNADRLISSRIAYTPAPGDIVVITMPETRQPPIVKRIIAIGGQTIDINSELGIVYVDGVAQIEPFAKGTTRSIDLQFPQTVPEGHVFVLGDNREHSHDSRHTETGMVDERLILGRVYYRILPFSSIGVLE